ncbi:MAG: hydrogenase iron-sulfur subunit [Alphaproteobacteria bacterium]|nr:hydrogenase iron-sulfur subunit [Alphaproteobacteria bacterium]
MDAFRKGLRWVFLTVEGWLDLCFPERWNPLRNLGALGFFYLWVVTVSGIYVYIFYDTGAAEAYLSVEAMTHEQRYAGGIMRSLHRYASDGMVLFMAVHTLRELAFDRYRGPRWFTWVTGVPIMALVFVCGITGYWLVWDKLAQYVAIATAEWLDVLPIFGSPIARNFLTPQNLEPRFFTLLMFLHIAVPLILLLVLWIHLQRVSRPRMHAPRGLAMGSFAMLLALSLVKPALSQGPADLGQVPSVVGLDWFYLVLYPLIDVWSPQGMWGVLGALLLMLTALPWMPPMRRAPPALVGLDNCNGCTRCAVDCPMAAITMAPRSDGKPFEREAVVDPDLCVSCGLCAGACPTATPVRRVSAFVPGIDLQHLPLRDVRESFDRAGERLRGEGRVLVIGCDQSLRVRDLERDGVAAVSLPCIGMLPPSFIDYALSRGIADGVLVTGCRPGDCQCRLGVEWTEARLAGTRDPRLRDRVPRERVAVHWAAATERRDLERAVAGFAARLRGLEGASAAQHAAAARRAGGRG